MNRNFVFTTRPPHHDPLGITLRAPSILPCPVEGSINPGRGKAWIDAKLQLHSEGTKSAKTCPSRPFPHSRVQIAKMPVMRTCASSRGGAGEKKNVI